MRDSLEQLLQESIAQARAKKGSAGPKLRVAHANTLVPLSSNAETNWELVGQVQLVHKGQDVETLVGLFDEYKHRQMVNTRRLKASVRADDSPQPRIEYVTGDTWLYPESAYLRAQSSTTKLSICEDLALDMGLSAFAVMLDCFLVGGGIQRACLAQGTTFSGTTPRTFLCLPAGMDVLEGLDRGSKQRIWRAVRAELKMDEDAPAS